MSARNHVPLRTARKKIYLLTLSALTGLSISTPLVAREKQKDSTDEIQTLRTVEVRSTKDGPSEESYRVTKTRVGKTLQDPHDIPQAITSVPRALMNDQQVGSLREALRNVAGLTFNAAEGGRSGDNMMLRGFYTFGDIYLDGVRDTAQYNRETFNLEQVDVLRGSAAMLFGRGQAGGVINQVSKMAKKGDRYAVGLAGGMMAYYQATADMNKQLSDTTAIRINLMHRHEETYRKNPITGDHPEVDRSGAALSFGTGIGTNNEFFLNHVYTRTGDVPDYGIGFLDSRPVSTSTNGRNDKTFWGNKNNFDDSETHITTAQFTHKFNRDTQIRTQVRRADYERTYWAKTPGTTLPALNNSIGGNPTRTMDYETWNVQTDLSTRFEIAGTKHQLLGGFEYLREDSYRHTLQAYNLSTGLPYPAGPIAPAITAANGIFYKPYNTARAGTPVSFKADNYAVYIQDTIEFVRNWELLLGMRRDELRADYSSVTSPKLSYGENSYRAGLSWKRNIESHYYVSYSSSFSPTADLYQLTVKPQPPERSTTYEAGAKWLLMDGDLALRTAIYHTVKDWERNTDLESVAAILTKKRRTNGIEFELTGNITDNWQVFSGLAIMDAEILRVAENINPTTGAITLADPRFVGQRARNAPTTTFNLWTTYQFAWGWRIGGGVEVKGERYGYVPSSTNANALFATGSFQPNTLPAYARFDVMVAYEQPKWGVRLNIRNLFNKTYYDALYDNGGFSVPGNQRQAILSTEIRF